MVEPNDHVNRQASRLCWLVCPTRFESRFVAKRFRQHHGVRVETIGVGPAAATRGLVRIETELEPNDLVLLVGLAAGLTESMDRDRICVASKITGLEPPAQWTPTWPPHEGVHSASIVGVDRIVSKPAEKRQLAAVTGADTLDMESQAFASWAAGRDWQWGVVRVILDAVNDPLPDVARRWIDETGAVRRTRVISDAIRSKSHREAARMLGRRADLAMSALVSWLHEAIGSEA